jgi:16S rRNA (cytidine1402-2'-O)-methyltransferase
MARRRNRLDNQDIGTLYLVGTPIGNLGDITLRALETLKSVDLIAAEDTRQTQKLLGHFSIRKPVTSYYEHNKRTKGEAIIEELLMGKKIALVSDAGMPGISDPGSDLVRECIEKNIEISVIPGPSAVLAGLVASGQDTSTFVFAGFFPRQTKDKKRLMEELAKETKTIIFYQSPHRLCSTLEEIKDNWGERNCCVAREITKIYEEYKRGTLSEVLQYYQEKNIKGEITLVIEGYKPETTNYSWEEIESRVCDLIAQGLSRKEAVKEAAGEYGIPRRELYNRIMR